MSNKTYQYFILAQSLLAISTSALAEGAFDGVGVSAGVGFESLNNKMKSESYIGSYNGQFDKNAFKLGDDGVAGNVGLTYSHGFSNKFNVAASVFYNFGSNNSGKLFNDINWKIKDAWGISLEPGYYFTDTTLGYMKLGYAQASSKINNVNNDSVYEIDFGKAHGFLYGAGVKQFISKNTYLGVDAYQVSFDNSKTVAMSGLNYSNTPVVTYGGISLGYIFNETNNPPSLNHSSLEAHGFDGMNLQLALGGVAINNKLAGDVGIKAGETGLLSSVSVGYSAALSNRFNLATNLFYNFGKHDSGYLTGLEFKTKDIWGVSFEPGYYFSENTLGYAKIGYAKSTMTFSQYGYSSYSFPSSDGLLFGVGLKQLLTDKIYLGAEAYRINFKATSEEFFEASEALDNKTSFTFAGLVAGYKF